MQTRTEEAIRKTDRKIQALEKNAEKAEEVDHFEQCEKSLQIQKALIEQIDASLEAFQQANAKPKPDLKDVPAEVLDSLWQDELSLPESSNRRALKAERREGTKGAAEDETPGIQSGIGGVDGQGSTGMGTENGSGFERACPAYSYSEPEEGDDSSGTLKRPAGGVISAGTWSYPGGGMHLGIDFATAMYSQITAPADGVIIYANNPVGDGGGYLGNWTGWPYGSGNSVAMIVKSGSKLYAITFAHLSSKIKVRAGQQVSQGDLLALSGNTGNSTGPHTHVEVFTIRVSFDEIASYFSKTADFAFGTGWDAPATCSAYACRVRPENYFSR